MSMNNYNSQIICYNITHFKKLEKFTFTGRRIMTPFSFFGTFLFRFTNQPVIF